MCVVSCHVTPIHPGEMIYIDAIEKGGEKHSVVEGGTKILAISTRVKF